jgi:hypothetical protein
MAYIVKKGRRVWVESSSYSIISKERAEQIEANRIARLAQLNDELKILQAEYDRINNETWPDVNVQLKQLETLDAKILLKRAEIKKCSVSTVQQRDSWGILIYSDGAYFNYFYAKHVMHNLGRNSKEKTGSVLVLDSDTLVSHKLARAVLEQALRDMVARPKIRETDVIVPKIVDGVGYPFNVRTWDFYDEKWVSAPGPGYFAFREISEYPSETDLSQEIKEDKVTQKVLDDVNAIIKGAKTPDKKYVVQYVFFVDKYFIASGFRRISG